MSEQAHHWSRAAKSYEADFIDPYRPDVESPLLEALSRLADPARKTAADLGCGIGPLLSFLAEQFHHVHAVDFAEGMLERARERCRSLRNIKYLQRPLTDLKPLVGQVDVAVAVNSLIMPDLSDLEASLAQVRLILRPGGTFVGIVPGMDAVHYYTMLLVDRAREAGKPLEAARENAAHFCEHQTYDFAFGQFYYQGLEQHFWQPFEVRYRLQRAGFRLRRLARVRLSWEQFAFADELRTHPAPWDWFFEASIKD